MAQEAEVEVGASFFSLLLVSYSSATAPFFISSALLQNGLSHGLQSLHRCPCSVLPLATKSLLVMSTAGT